MLIDYWAGVVVVVELFWDVELVEVEAAGGGVGAAFVVAVVVVVDEDELVDESVWA